MAQFLLVILRELSYFIVILIWPRRLPEDFLSCCSVYWLILKQTISMQRYQLAWSESMTFGKPSWANKYMNYSSSGILLSWTRHYTGETMGWVSVPTKWAHYPFGYHLYIEHRALSKLRRMLFVLRPGFLTIQNVLCKAISCHYSFRRAYWWEQAWKYSDITSSAVTW